VAKLQSYSRNGLVTAQWRIDDALKGAPVNKRVAWRGLLMRTLILACASALALSACASMAQPAKPAPAPAQSPPPQPKTLRPGLDPTKMPDPFASTYRAPAAAPFAIVNATILTAAGPRIDGGTVLVRDGKIAAVGNDVAVPQGVRVIDAKGRYVTPGIIDPHSHIGAGSSPREASGDDSNENNTPAGIWVENSVWAQDPMFDRAMEAGVTSLQVLPGSAHPINGRSVILKNVPAVDMMGMKFPGATGGLKMACGENPSGGRNGGSGTRAGVMREWRTAFINAADYSAKWAEWRRRGTGDPPKRDLAMENVAAALDGQLKVQIHCYRADEMLQMIDLSHEFGFKIAAFHHANEAFKIAPQLAKEHIAVATWAGDWAGYKMEAYDSIMETPGFIEKAGGLVAIKSDDVQLMQHLNQEAARSMTASREAGIPISEETAIRWITLNPAKIIGVDDRTGSLEVGKMADVLIWDTNPFSVYALPDDVFVDGVLLYDRATAFQNKPRSDYELGNVIRREPRAYPVPSWENDR
jgi:imidazolonepropionase-like amidohydrolase